MDFAELMRLASGYAEARAIQAAIELGIFEAIGDGSLASSVAIAIGGDERGTRLLLNGLVALNLLEKADDRYRLTPVAKKYLLRASPQYVGGMILFDAGLWGCWGDLAAAVRRGAPARAPDMYQGNPSETEVFIHAMDSLVKARGDGEWLANTIEWSRLTELLDVGSGPATYPIQLCQRFPHLHAVVFDLPGTLRITERYVRQAGLSDRISLVAGDYRSDSIPGGYDVVFLSNIIHGEGLEQNELLVRKLASNLKLGGQLMIKDHILGEGGTHPEVGAIFSLLMLLTTNAGRCYTFNEVKSWMQRAGLSRVRRIDLPAPFTSSLAIGEKREHAE